LWKKERNFPPSFLCFCCCFVFHLFFLYSTHFVYPKAQDSDEKSRSPPPEAHTDGAKKS
jgi:hypothetical protein